MLKYISDSEEKTKNIASKLACFLTSGVVICLYGNLGAGKTVFASGLSTGLGLTEHISSPTFTIVNEYIGKYPFYHFDVYRINSDEFLDMGGDEYLFNQGIVLIEWPENIIDVLPHERLDIYINYPPFSAEDNNVNINKREIIFKPLGKKYEEIIEKLLEVIK